MLFDRVRDLVASTLPSPVEFRLETPPDPKFGDVACNAAMLIAKSLGKNPREVATEIAAKLEASELVAKVEIAGPGFINIFLHDAAVWSSVGTADQAPVNKQPQTVVVEYGGENIAKPMSIGHLRSNIIGQSLANIFRFLGWHVVTDNFLGDWGTQFGKAIVGYKKWGNEEDVRRDPLATLLDLYVRFHEEAKEHPELEDEARAEFKKLEDGDAENRRLWEWFRAVSLENLEVMHRRLGVHFDAFHGEAFYEPVLREIIADLIAKGVAIQNEDGSVMVAFPEEFSPSPLLIQKSDGATLYATRDIAAVKHYVETHHPALVLQGVGAEQSLQMKQKNNAAKRAGYMGDATFVHVASGLVRLPEGKMSTRSGRIVKLDFLLDEAEEKMRTILDEKGCDITGDEREQLIRDLAVGAVKFADLGKSRESTITFTWESALSFDGYAAPYLMYTHARARSILRKAEISPSPSLEKRGDFVFSDPSERQLALRLDRFVDVVRDAASEYHPHIIAQYIFDVAQDFNGFYHKVSVLSADNEHEKLVRLVLVAKTADVIKAGLSLLGITAPERM